MRACSADLRERVLADCDGGMGTRAVAAKYRVSESWVRRLKQVRRETGRTAQATRRRGPTPGLVAHADAIRAAVAAAPTEYRRRFAPPLSRSALARALAARGLPQKIKSVRATGQDRLDVAAARTAWRADQPGLDPDKLVFVGETRASTRMARTRGARGAGGRW